MIMDKDYITKREDPKNKVHFYMARDKDGTLWLYLGKPLRGDTAFFSGVDGNVVTLTHYNFKYFGLNVNDYANLKWEDEPLEVFVNMED